MPSPFPWRLVAALLLIQFFAVASSTTLPREPASSDVTASSDAKALKVGEEIKGETIPLRSGRRVYELLGLRRSVSYEIKISYPASIPASFSIQLHKYLPELLFRKNRRLLNTEKLIFKSDNDESIYAVLTVEAEGVVAMKNVQDLELVIYNIVCDELILGIPHGAWWVGVTALICLLLGMAIPYLFPLHRLLNTEGLEAEVATSKLS